MTPVLWLRFLRLVRQLWDFRGPGLALTLLLATLAAAAEGMGILLMVPLLQLLGVEGSWVMPPEHLGIRLPAFGLETVLALYVVLVTGAAGAAAWWQLTAARLRLGFVQHLRGRLHAAVVGLEWRSFVRLRGSTLTHTLVHDVDQADAAVDFLLSTASTAMQLAVSLAAAVTLSPAMTAFGVAGGAVLWPLAGRLNRRIYRLAQGTGLAWQALHDTLAEDIASFRLIKAFRLEAVRRRAFTDGMDGVRGRELALRRMLAVGMVVRRSAAALGGAAAVMVMVRGFGLGVAETLAVLVALVRVLMALARLGDGWRNTVHSLPAHARTMALLARCRAAAEPDEEDATAAADSFAGDIVFDAVTVRYTADRPPALKGICAVIPYGSLVVVTGPSGAGKSTLGDVLLGLIEPQEGLLTIGGAALRGARRRAWRRHVAMVPQDAVLFHDSIRANLTVVAPAASDAELWLALAAARADGVVRALPDGLDTVVGDRGTALSGGERQRLALARALLRRPAMLLLDEPTSALDSVNEEHILSTVRALRGRMTVVLITHRLSGTSGVDGFLRLDHGELADGAGVPRTVLLPG